jgi:hypothetical protein
MSHQCLADAFAPAVAAYRAEVLKETWGHLAAAKNKKYHGTLTFACGIFGSDDLNPTAIACEFKTRKGETLESSPWFYDAMMEFMQEQETEAGGVYRFEGYFRNYEFHGTIRRLNLDPQPQLVDRQRWV